MWMFTLLALSRFVVAGPDNSSQAENYCKLSPTHLSTIAFSRVKPHSHHSAYVMQWRVIERVYKLGL
ncbi:hypothetical protein HBI56_076350 [Parastagonospora nodorum]|uniref:Secreted protein n=1 Tax=Phaeosphaeria nodorum (strain SN15 / ATCC MYA-4574 / FGSC 10173) TaxID=321614 RepID=A0A7U2EWV0_PHANO|nr:hypothetical protein HBH56_150810 [Parastagonospora nodorum]QRC94296.1 hypothetical protein JI435_405570 [Parastagonospora nodorum SN15]KAH3928398.1 hypothetical protein HBH54_136710 [Parastagonospora nodorum]KAH3985886.1 hypothetical protein HBH51_020510 [Parastagonospora nodorum]KAH4003830.1 hypothetical protein HBI10_059670 [Parastagonospora nodorum]